MVLQRPLDGRVAFGGLVAFEMARQLARAGAVVGAVILLDTYVPSPELAVRFDPSPVLAMLGERLRARGLPLAVDDPRPEGVDAARSAMAEAIAAAGWLPREEADEFLTQMLSTAETYTHAGDRYAPEPYPGALTLVRARDTPPRRADAPALSYDWSVLCRGELRVEVVAGTHQSMIEPPHVDALAEVLRRVLDESRL